MAEKQRRAAGRPPKPVAKAAHGWAKDGPRRPSNVLAERLREVRDHKGWTQQGLAERLREANTTIADRATVAKIEAGTRKVTLDETLWLAAVLDVAPPFLVLPTKGLEHVEVLPGYAIDAASAREWFTGREPLGTTQDEEFFYRERSDFERLAHRQPGLWHLEEVVRRFATALIEGDDEDAATRLDQIEGEVQRQRAAIADRAKKKGTKR